MAVVEVRERPPSTADVNGKEQAAAPAVPIAVNAPHMTRAQREALIALRRSHVTEWQADLEQLPHFNPAYPYDIAHEYDLDWTTDPDYSHDAVTRLELNEDGTVSPEKPKNRFLNVAMLTTLLAALGRRVVLEPRLHFGPEQGAAAGLYTKLRKPSIQVEPDLAVLAPGTVLSDRQIWDTSYDIDVAAGHPVPALVGELLSDSTAARDLGGKRQLYEHLGIAEYVLCDVLGGLLDPDAPDAPPGMVVYRLENGVYRESRVAGTDPAVFRSDVLGGLVRLLPPRDPVQARQDFRFQWWDEAYRYWRDARTDEERERKRAEQERERAEQERERAEQERERAEQERTQAEQERTQLAVALLDAYLGSMLPPADLDRITAHWHRHGPPDNVQDRILQVRQAPHAWQSLLRPDKPDPDHGPDHTPPPRGW